MLNLKLSEIKNIEFFSEGGYIPPDMKVVMGFLELLERCFREEHDPKFYSERMGLNLELLTGLTKFYLSKSVHRLICERIHQEAIKLLRYSRLNIKQISYELGFSDPTWFSRCFSKNEGMSPRNWKRIMVHEALVSI
ncbi:AraC family transcriptional regulator [Pedobacter frigoris]|uniref:helix-turn-helix domain-containing protein n=1 Tax=Pedobacter frigoris TaxID=2571272 RepID=UPI00292F9652|nr:AraC family transcriptional regulator [Pedobacter frigoris]